MKTKSSMVALCCALLLAGCSSSGSRIKDNQALFDTYPAETQAAIRDGTVLVGFTPEQARMALGKPDRTYTRKTTNGTSEVWAYQDSSPSFGFGVGMGMGVGRSSSVGTGVGMSTRDDWDSDRLRLVFEDGKVSSVETREK